MLENRGDFSPFVEDDIPFDKHSNFQIRRLLPFADFYWNQSLFFSSQPIEPTRNLCWQ